MNKDKTYLIILLFFVLIILTPIIIIILNSRNDRQPKKTILSSYKPGSFIIEGTSQANVNVPFSLVFITNSNDQPVNSVSLQATFDPSALEVIKVDTTQSFCQFYPENRFNNVQGTLAIQCGAPHPGFKGESIIAKVQFMPKSITQTKITVTEKSMILVNDGKGSNIFSQPINHIITIQNNI